MNKNKYCQVKGNRIVVSYCRNGLKYFGLVEVEYSDWYFEQEFPFSSSVLEKFDFVGKTLEENGNFLRGMYIYLRKEDVQ
jgi:hypothetical protein